MKINSIAFVGVPVTDLKRARSFYEDVLGLKVSDEMMGGKWIEYSLGNNTLAIANVGGARVRCAIACGRYARNREC